MRSFFFSSLFIIVVCFSINIFSKNHENINIKHVSQIVDQEKTFLEQITLGAFWLNSSITLGATLLFLSFQKLSFLGIGARRLENYFQHQAHSSIFRSLYLMLAYITVMPKSVAAKV